MTLAAPSTIEARKAEAATIFGSHGVPSRRVEEWKYSDLKVALGEAGIGTEQALWQVDAVPDGVTLFDLSKDGAPDWVQKHFAVADRNIMGAASLALSDGGVALRVAKGAQVSAPLKLAFHGAGHVRGLLVLEAGASLTLVESVGVADFRNVGFEIVLGEGASLEHIRISPEAADAVLVEEVSLRIAADGRYRAHFAGFGSKLSRMELEIALEGEGAEAHLSGVSVLSGDNHADITTRVTHAVGNTQSTQLFKKVAGGKSRAIYQGKVTVAKGANGADSRQTAKALLLGTRAEADLKPELEIFADDVKCAHGAAVGDLDADSLFYLRARGISEKDARHLLIHAFLEDALTDIANVDLREAVRGAVSAALSEVAA